MARVAEACWLPRDQGFILEGSAKEKITTHKPTTEDQAKDLFVRQLNDLRRRGAAPESEARLAAIFARSEAACREQEARLMQDDEAQHAPTPPAS